MDIRNLLNMAGHSRLTVEDIANFCAGDSLSDASLEEYLKDFEEQSSFEEESDDELTLHSNDDEQEDNRVEAMLVGAYKTSRAGTVLCQLRETPYFTWSQT